jgi:hypothetical protein
VIKTRKDESLEGVSRKDKSPEKKRIRQKKDSLIGR